MLSVLRSNAKLEVLGIKPNCIQVRSFIPDATDYALIVDIQNLRVEAVRRQLESSYKSFDKIGPDVWNSYGR